MFRLHIYYSNTFQQTTKIETQNTKQIFNHITNIIFQIIVIIIKRSDQIYQFLCATQNTKRQMESDLYKLKYIECQKGNYHQGQLLNMICLEDTCLFDPLLCCICADENHKNHLTTSIKKFINDMKQACQKSAKDNKSKEKIIKNYHKLYQQRICQMISIGRKKTIMQFKTQSTKLDQNLTNLQQAYESFCKRLQQETRSQSELKSSQNLSQCINNIEKSQNLSSMLPPVQKLIATINLMNGFQQNKQKHDLTFDQQILLNIFQTCNKQLIQNPIQRVQCLEKQLKNSQKQIKKQIGSIQKIFSAQNFKFTKKLKTSGLKLISNYQIRQNSKYSYQAALMQPGINQNTEITSFSFKVIKVVPYSPVSIGICNQEVLNFKFADEFLNNIDNKAISILLYQDGDINSNNKLNNVPGFKFCSGDIITTIVNKKHKTLFFVKNLKKANIIQGTAKNFISFQDIHYVPYDSMGKQLYPCFCSQEQNQQVQLVPTLDFNIGEFKCSFSEQYKHEDIYLMNNNKFSYLPIDCFAGYRSVLFNKNFQQNLQQKHVFSIKMAKSSTSFIWIALGICNSKTVQQKKYQFYYNQPQHGYYMISSNGGSWSSTNQQKNNYLQAFKFSQGDIVKCTVTFGDNSESLANKIEFSKGEQRYELNFKRLPNDPICACVMFHYGGDYVMILPQI